jgi:hypothetical protein
MRREGAVFMEITSKLKWVDAGHNVNPPPYFQGLGSWVIQGSYGSENPIPNKEH